MSKKINFKSIKNMSFAISLAATTLSYFLISFSDVFRKNSFLFLIVLIFNLIAVCIFTNYILSSLVSTTEEIKKAMKEIQSNNLTYTIIAEEARNLTDASAEVNSAINKLRESFKTFKYENEYAYDLAKLTYDKTDSANLTIQNILSKTQEMSASVQESAASIEELNEQVNIIKTSGDNIKTQSNLSIDVAKEIKDNSFKVVEQSSAIKEQASNIYNKSKTLMESSIKDMDVINKIFIMAESINSVAAQANMLGLNASIESAKAGENGKGFTIVANEIRNLSEEISTTAKEIQNILNEVKNFIENLSTASTETIENMRTLVDSYSQSLDSICNNYYLTGETIELTLTELNFETNAIIDSINTISSNLNTLSMVVADSASNSASISTEAISVIDNMTKVLDTAKESMVISKQSIDTINTYKS